MCTAAAFGLQLPCNSLATPPHLPPYLCSHFALFASGLCSLQLSLSFALLRLCRRRLGQSESAAFAREKRTILCMQQIQCVRLDFAADHTLAARQRKREGEGRERGREGSRHWDRVFHFSPSSIECTAAAAAVAVCRQTECN